MWEYRTEVFSTWCGQHLHFSRGQSKKDTSGCLCIVHTVQPCGSCDLTLPVVAQGLFPWGKGVLWCRISGKPHQKSLKASVPLEACMCMGERSKHRNWTDSRHGKETRDNEQTWRKLLTLTCGQAYSLNHKSGSLPPSLQNKEIHLA